MTVVLAGGSGFLGSRLRAHLERDGHRVLNLTRSPRADRAGDLPWQPDGPPERLAPHLEGIDAIVNLAGENIAGAAWSDARKAELRNSRLAATRSIVRAMAACDRPPKTLVHGSAVGYYGAHGDEMVTERTPPGSDFLAQLCVDWEQEARAGGSTKTRLTIIRSGLVLGAEGGALKKMLLPFKLGLGATLGEGGREFRREAWHNHRRFIVACNELRDERSAKLKQVARKVREQHSARRFHSLDSAWPTDFASG